MFGILLALSATSILASPPAGPHIVAPPETAVRQQVPLAHPSAATREQRADRALTDQADEPAPDQRLNPIWIPLPCTRVGMRMVC